MVTTSHSHKTKASSQTTTTEYILFERKKQHNNNMSLSLSKSKQIKQTTTKKRIFFNYRVTIRQIPSEEESMDQRLLNHYTNRDFDMFQGENG
jgi:hypothetical protein